MFIGIRCPSNGGEDKHCTRLYGLNKPVSGAMSDIMSSIAAVTKSKKQKETDDYLSKIKLKEVFQVASSHLNIAVL